MQKQTIIIGGITILLAVIIFGSLASYIGVIHSSDEIQSEQTGVGNEFFITDSEKTLTIPEIDNEKFSFVSLSQNVNNDTWLDFNKSNSLVNIPCETTESITFWYKNETSDWFFVSNSSGDIYTNGVIGMPSQYPLYYNGTHYILGKEDETTPLNVSIDSLKIYNSTIDNSLIELVYAGGRI